KRDVVFAVHDKQLAAHGGLGGVRDLNAVESALNRAQMLDAYVEPPPDVAASASAHFRHCLQPRVQRRQQAYCLGDRSTFLGDQRRDACV
ncbi:MAG: hypothetical protein WKG03_13505, partial [Telluria sp.]